MAARTETSDALVAPTALTLLQPLEEAPEEIGIACQGPVNGLCAGLVVSMGGPVSILHHCHPLLVPVDQSKTKPDPETVAR